MMQWVYAQEEKEQTPQKKQTGTHRLIVNDTLLIEAFKKHGITEKKLAKLKQIGVDLRDYAAHWWEVFDPRIDAANKDLVIIGTVLSMLISQT